MTELPSARRSIRVPGYAYAMPGAYFVTICAYRRALLFEDSTLAALLYEEWLALTDRFPSVGLDAFVAMPNHVHFTVWLTHGRTLTSADAETGTSPAPMPVGDVDSAVGVPLAGTSSATGRTSTDRAAAGTGASPAPTLGDVVGAYKSHVAVRWLAWVKSNDPGRSGRVWQRNYYERVVRDEPELNRIREYIMANPAMWNRDPENLTRVPEPAYDEAWSWLEDS